MKNKINLSDYLPRQIQMSLVQANVPTELRNAVKRQMEQEGLTWNDLFLGLLSLYVDQSKLSTPVLKKKQG